MGRPPHTEQQFVANFWARVNKAGPIPVHRPELGPCWVWIGTVDKDGYGRAIWKSMRMQRANRVAWFLRYGSIPDGKQVLHHCDNPPCVNDSHLFLGTNKDNCQDALMKGRNYIGSKNPFFGKRHTEETRHKISVAHTGKICSPEVLHRLRTMHIGRKRSPEQLLHYKEGAKKRWANRAKEVSNSQIGG